MTWRLVSDAIGPTGWLTLVWLKMLKIKHVVSLNGGHDVGHTRRSAQTWKYRTLKSSSNFLSTTMSSSERFYPMLLVRRKRMQFCEDFINWWPLPFLTGKYWPRLISYENHKAENLLLHTEAVQSTNRSVTFKLSSHKDLCCVIHYYPDNIKNTAVDSKWRWW